jgi:hypothetical protein
MQCEKYNFSVTEIAGQFNSPDRLQEVRAMADSAYKENTSQLLVELDSSLWSFSGQSNEIQADWLPDSDTVGESVSLPEAFDAVKEIFASLVRPGAKVDSYSSNCILIVSRWHYSLHESRI